MGATTGAIEKKRPWGQFRKTVAGVAAGSLVAGVLVAVGIGASVSHANPFTPTVDVETGTYLAGEDLPVTITFGNTGGGAQYNLSAGILVDANVNLADPGTLGAPREIIGASPNGTLIPGNYLTAPQSSEYCEAHGLAPGIAGDPAGACRVPVGKKYLVFQNISDLPAGASTSHTITLRPSASTVPADSPSNSTFPVGSEIEIDVFAYTSNVERLIPTFPGARGVSSADNSHTSGQGIMASGLTHTVDVRALRIEKIEDSPESELLRGVHDHVTTYTLRIYHTSEGVIDAPEIRDYLPAGLEYLGNDLADSSEAEEYSGSGPLNPADTPAGADNRGGAWVLETSITTVGDVDGLPGGVYTEVVWDLAAMLGVGDTRDTVTGENPIAEKQDFSGDTRGISGVMEIKYRAGIPLFENTMDFGGDTPTPDSLEQGANLDNNNGASTRHGSANDDDRPGQEARGLTNFAFATGSYDGNETSDDTSHSVDAVDVRLLKEVNNSQFQQDGIARYTLNIATSEYVTADKGATRPDRIVDDLANGICPVFPEGTTVTGGGDPNLRFGNPNTWTIPPASLSPAVWNSTLTGTGANQYGVDPECAFPSGIAEDSDDAHALTGATLTGITFDPDTGHFFLDLDLTDGLEGTAHELSHAPSGEIEISYSAKQKAAYQETNIDGATSSGDSVANYAEVVLTTTPYAPTQDLPGIGNDPWFAHDDSEAVLTAALSDISKHVLKRSFEIDDPATDFPLSEANESNWVKTPDQNDPFVPGDEVWYRITLDPPVGADIRNPKFTDFFPAGVKFDDTKVDGQFENIVVKPRSLRGLGSCVGPYADDAAWLAEFAPSDQVSVDENVLNWQLGSADCLAGDDFFLPLDTVIDFYIKVEVTDVSSFAEVDLPQNLVKYQQNNVNGEIFFLRDSAEIELDGGPRLIKGIRNVIDGAIYLEDFEYNSDHEPETLEQTEKVQFRLDVTAPQTTSSGYVIWDALPEGVRKADLDGFDSDDGTFTSTASTVTQEWFSIPPLPGPGSGYWFTSENSADPWEWTARAYDPGDPAYGSFPGDPGYPSGVRGIYDERTIVVWEFNGDVPGSLPERLADPDAEPWEEESRDRPTAQGLTLGYTLKVPSPGPGGGDPAQIGQEYVNDASILELQFENNNGSSDSTLIINGSDGPGAVHVANTRTPDPDNGIFGFEDEANVASDFSFFDIEEASMAKSRYATEVAPAGTTPVPALVDANNPANVIVQGEYAWFDISVTIPANTTVRDGLLKDDGVLRWTSNPGGFPANGSVAYHLEDAEVVEAPWLPGAMLDDFTLDWNDVAKTGDGSLSFPDAAAGGYTNTTAVDQTFKVRLKVWIDDTDESGAPTPAFNLSNNVTLTNTARFTYTDAEGADAGLDPATATVVYREPAPSLTKTVEGSPGADGVVTFTLIAGNGANRPALYDAVVYDCLPPGFEDPGAPDNWNFDESQGTLEAVVANGCSTTGTGANQRVLMPGDSTGTLITWNVGTLLANQSETLEFDAKIDPAAGGGATYTNRAHIVGYTLPATGPEALPDASDRRGDRATGVSRDVPLDRALLAKSVTPTSAPVGDTVRYTLTTTIPANANFWDAQLIDTLPTGLSYIGNPTVTFTGGPTFTQDLHVSGQTVTWPATAGGADAARIDIPFVTTERTITISFDARINDSVGTTNPVNRATFYWNVTNGSDPTRTNTPEATTTVTLLHPVVGLTKKVEDRTVSPVDEDAMTFNPDGTFQYEITVFNSGTASVNQTPAHGIAMQDVVPPGVIVTPASIAPIPSNLATISADLAAGNGATIIWDPIDSLWPTAMASPTQPNTATFSYNGEFVDAVDLTIATKTNTASVTEYFSWDPNDEGRQYVPGSGGVPSATDTASVTPIVPSVVLQKTVSADNPANPSTDVAFAGTPFGWTLRATNDGAGDALNLSMSDRLPENWIYDIEATRAPVVSLNGGAPLPLAAPTIDPGDARNLSWSEAQIRDALGLTATPEASVLAGKVGTDSSSYLEIRFSTIPQAAALGEAGVTTDGGVPVPHTNTLTAVATDTRDDTGLGGGDYSPDTRDADAFLHSADLRIVKDAIGGTTGNAPAEHPLFGVPAGEWIIGQVNEIVGGVDVYTQPQWQITVTNHGPDASFGPFVINDTLTLDTGITTGNWTATYYPTAADAAGGANGTVLGTDLTGADLAAGIGSNGTRLLADGSDLIVLTANVTIDAATTEPGAVAHNVADVLGRTFEPTNKQGPAPNPNPNEDDATRTATESADLAVVKTMTNTGGLVNAGGTINWSIQPVNYGPSVSRNIAGNQITITDAVPTGVSGVADPSNGVWEASLDGGLNAWPAGTTAAAGDTITFTLNLTQPSLLVGGVGVHAAITLSGTVDPAWTPTSGPADNGSILNEAVIAPGLTPDPVPTNNDDDAPANPTFDTTLGIAKDRVIWDPAADGGDGAWVRTASMNPDDVPPVNAGDQVSYLVTVSNSGLAVARNVQVVDEHTTDLYNATSVTHATPTDPTAAATWTRTAHAAPNTHWDVFALGSDLPVSASRAFVVTYDTRPTLPAEVENCVVANSADNGATPPRACADFDSDRLSNLAIVKTHTLPGADVAANAGEVVTYRLVVTNTGPSDARGPITVTDELPLKFSYVTGSATVDGVLAVPAVTGDPEVGGQTLEWEVLADTGTLPLNGTITVEFEALIAADHPEQDDVENVATVDGPDDTDPSDDTSRDEIDVETLATMTIDKVVTSPAAPGPWLAGTDVTYTLTVVNSGPSVAPATVVDTLPTGLTMVSMTSADPWLCTTVPGTQTGTCLYDGVHPVGVGAATEITVVAHLSSSVVTGTDLVNDADLTWTDSREFPDPTTDPRNDADDATINVTTQADLGLVKTAVDADGDPITSAVAGQTATYQLDVTNYGPSDAVADLVVVDTLPLGVRYLGPLGTTVSNWTILASAYDPAVQQTVTFTRTAGGINRGLPMVGTAPTLAPSILFEVRLSPSLEVTDPPAVEPLVNTAAVSSGTPDPDPSNDDDDAPLDVTRLTNVSIDKDHVTVIPVDEFEVGDTVSYTFDVENTGPSVSSGVTVTDKLPLGLTLDPAFDPSLGISGVGWTLDSAVPDADGRIDIVASYAPSVAPGASTSQLVLTAGVTVGIGDVTSIDNTACVAVNETNSNLDPCDTDTIVTVPLADLTIGKAATTLPADVTAGEPVTWLITPRNLGPSTSVSTTANPITVTDTLPAGILRLTADPSTALWAATTSNAGGWAEATVGDTITWSYTGTAFAVGAEPDIVMTTLIDPAWHGGDITNRAAVVPGDTRDPNPLPPSNEDDDTVTPDDSTGLSILKNRVVQVDGEWVLAASLTPMPEFAPGAELSFRIDVINNGPAIARDVRVIDPIPAGLGNPRLSELPGKGTWSDTTASCEAGLDVLAGYPAIDCVTAALGEPLGIGISEGRSFVVSFDTDPALDPSVPVVNWAQARATNVPEPDRPSDVEPTDGTPAADLSLVKTATQDRVLSGGTIDYRLLVTNEGPSISRGPVTVTDQLPIGMSYVPGSAKVTWLDGTELQIDPSITSSLGSELLTWVPVRLSESLAPGETVVIELQTEAASGIFSPSGLVNVAVVDSPDDIDPFNDEDDATVLIDPVVTLVTAKQLVGQLQVGKVGVFEITVQNLGPTLDPGPITVTDVLPKGLAYRATTTMPAGASVDVSGQTVTWVLPTGLQVGEITTIEIEVDVLQAAYPEVTNTVTVDSPAEKTPESVLEDQVTVPVKAADPLEVTGGDIAGGVLAAMTLLLLLGGGTYLAGRGRKRAKHYA